MDETTAVARLKQGDIGGLEFLVRLYYVGAVRTAYLITHDRDLAEDVVQTAFIRSYENIGQFDAHRAFAPWFSRIVVNDAIKAATRHSARELSLGNGADGEAAWLEDNQCGPEEWLEQSETRREVWQALSQLSPLQRAVIVLRFYLGLSEAETAARLNCAVGTIKAHSHAARKHLRDLLGNLHNQR